MQLTRIIKTADTDKLQWYSIDRIRVFLHAFLQKPILKLEPILLQGKPKLTTANGSRVDAVRETFPSSVMPRNSMAGVRGSGMGTIAATSCTSATSQDSLAEINNSAGGLDLTCSGDNAITFAISDADVVSGTIISTVSEDNTPNISSVTEPQVSQLLHTISLWNLSHNCDITPNNHIDGCVCVNMQSRIFVEQKICKCTILICI